MGRIRQSIYIIFFSALIYYAVFGFSAVFVKTGELIAETKKRDDFLIYPKDIEMSGIDRISREEVLVLTGLDKKKYFFDISEEKLEIYIRNNRWIKNCTVKKILPNRIKILIEEYKPAIIINSVEGHNGNKTVYTLWFADREGQVFKKAFPQESSKDLPFFYIDRESVESAEQKNRIRTAVEISEEWKKGERACAIQSIFYDLAGGYNIDCEFPDKKKAKVMLGILAKPGELMEKSNSFYTTAEKLRSNGMWAGEFSFEKEGARERVVIGQVIQKKIARESNAEK